MALPDLLTHLQSLLGDRYVVRGELGRGGMATVFRAQDLKHGRGVAIKVLNPEFAALLGERFLREINISAQLHHPHILPLHDSGSAEGFLYYVMPLVEGESLRDRLVRENQLPLEDALRIACDMADALAYAHSRGVVHRDIKPENILLQAGHALLADFGIAHAIAAAGEQRLTQTGVIIGTPSYMSPEQASGESHIDAQTDVYSLGCVLYEMLAGAPPYAGPTAQAIQVRRLTEAVPPIRTIRDAVPEALEEVVLKALARAPADRWSSASEFADALRHAGASAGRGSRPRARPRYIAALTVVALALPVLAGWFITHRRARGACPDDSPPPCAGWSPRPVTAPPPTSELARARAFLVLPFRDLSPTTEHRWLIEASPTMLADALGLWTEVTVVPDERLYPALRRHGLVPGSVMDLSLVALVAAETGGWTAVTGEVLGLPDRIRVSARGYDVVTQRLVSRPSVEIGLADDIRGAYEQIATALLHGAGLDQASADLVGATTRSLDAYRAYLRAVAHLNRAEYGRAREALLEAVHLDSTFAQAYAKLAEVSLLAFSVLEPDHPAYGYADRAAALSGRLPPRAASHVRALHNLLSADFTAARGELEQLVARDSNDVDALEALASVEFLDPLLVTTPAGVQRRGSLNAAVRLARRVLSLDPTRHGAYQGLVTIYSLAGGEPPGAVAGYRREQPRPVRSSVRAWCSCDFELAPAGGNDSAVTTPFAGPDVMLVPLLRDSLELVPVGSLRTIGRESLEAARARARAAARAWAQRWLAVGAGEAEAHRAAARVHELDGAFGEALRELDTGDSLGVEAEAEAVSARRMILLGKLGRFDDARRIADSLWQARYFSGDLFSSVPAMTEGYAWATNLFAAAGDVLRARALLTTFSARLALRLELAPAYAAAVAVLSGSAGGPNSPVVLPDGLRRAVRTALRAEQAKHPGDPLIGAWLRTLSAAFPDR